MWWGGGGGGARGRRKGETRGSWKGAGGNALCIGQAIFERGSSETYKKRVCAE